MCTCLCMNMYVCVCTNRKDSRGSGSSGGSGSGSGEQRWTMNYTFATIQYNLWRVSFGNAWKGTAPNIHKICIPKKLSIKDFKKHMNWTKNRFEVLKLAQAINLHTHQENKKKKTPCNFGQYLIWASYIHQPILIARAQWHRNHHSLWTS